MTEVPGGDARPTWVVERFAAVSTWLAAVAVVPTLLPAGWTQHGDVFSVMVSTGLLVAPLVASIYRAESGRTALLRTLFFGPLLGALNSGLGLAIAMLFHGFLFQALGWLLLGSMFGLVIGAPMGLLFGLGCLVPYLFVHRVRRQVNLGPSELVLVGTGAWLAFLGVAMLLCGAPSKVALTADVILLSVGFSALAVGGTSVARRAWWLMRVRRGIVSHFRIVAAAGVDPQVAAPRYWSWSQGEPQEFLIYAAPETSHPFRRHDPIYVAGL